MTPEQELSPEIYQHLSSGRKIEAIKLIREETGLGLREAKDLADALSEHRAAPDPFAPAMKEEGGAGGMAAIVIAILIAVAVYVFFLSE